MNAKFPAARLRRLRQQPWIRDLTRETRLSSHDLIWAVVVHDGSEPRIPVASMPGIARLSLDEAVRAAEHAQALSIPAIALFPHIDAAKKDRIGSEATNPDGLVPRAIRAMKAAAPGVGLIVDAALDPFTDHGHDGILVESAGGAKVLNDESVARLVDQALMQREAGADIIAPSDMMDGRIGAIRNALEKAGHADALILSYAAKYASAFYGPYREAIGTAAALRGDKKTYQMDFGNGAEALRECALDVAEGADMLMVKPGMPYLDVLYRVKQQFGMPTFAFQVSGEYAMLTAAAAKGWLDEERAILESLHAFKRAGADGIVTYFAPRAAELLAR